MENVLLPTDFTVQSLRPVHDIVKNAKSKLLTIHVVHLISLPTSISDLLFIKQNKPYHTVPANFMEALQLLQNKYSGSVEKIAFDFIYCSSSRYFNNFIEGNNIDAVYMLSDYRYRQPLEQSENIMYYLKKCKAPLHKVSINEGSFATYQHLSALLNGTGRLQLLQQASQ